MNYLRCQNLPTVYDRKRRGEIYSFHAMIYLFYQIFMNLFSARNGHCGRSNISNIWLKGRLLHFISFLGFLFFILFSPSTVNLKTRSSGWMARMMLEISLLKASCQTLSKGQKSISAPLSLILLLCWSKRLQILFTIGYFYSNSSMNAYHENDD